MEPAAYSPFALLPPRGSRVAGAQTAGPAGTADLPSAVPEFSSPGAPALRAEVLAALRASIQGIERPSLAGGRDKTAAQGAPLWRLGCPRADALLPLGGLETDSVHEVKAAVSGRGASGCGASAGDWMASLGFALRLAALRVAQARAAGRRPMLAWFWPRALAGELGRPSGQGLARLGLDPAGLLIVETAREVEAMLALEEGLKSGSLVLAIGVVKSVEINPARRLSLAAGAHKTPCLLLTHPASGAAASSATRWRIARAPSAPHPFDARAPGAMRFSVALERCRARPQSANLSPLLVEWCDETLRFGMAAELADDASGARRAASGAAR